MESRLRTVAKAATWQMLGLVTMSLLAWFQTGSIAGAFTFAASAALVGFVMFFIHERVWGFVRWGCQGSRADAQA
ncbi:MAG: hypothetical protein CMJ43_08530 [Phyllobacteriaceae bacterium]|nr:hypothetical protein [Phyllobacteriaceae bacterium]